MTEIALTEAVEQLRNELAKAVASKPENAIQFPVEGVTVAFQVGITKEGGASGGIKFHVLELSASGKYSKEAVQTVTVALGAPVNEAGERIWVADQSPAMPQ